MKKLILVLVPVIVVAAAALLTVLYSFSGPSSTPEGRTVDVEAYVSLNISELSPEAAVLGGTYYVTEIAAADGKGTVRYEDGHIAHTADFTYETEGERGIQITSFVVRE